MTGTLANVELNRSTANEMGWIEHYMAEIAGRVGELAEGDNTLGKLEVYRHVHAALRDVVTALKDAGN